MVLELRDVVKHYRLTEEICAVDGVSLKVEPGEFVGICGPSGAGKTTLLLLAAGMLAPERGSVIFEGIDLATLSKQQRARHWLQNVGLIRQTPLLGGGSALKQTCVKLLADGYSLREARPIARPWLDRVGLGKRAEHSPRQLSMGERQRVAIAQALVNEPHLILADEPTGNLDSTRGAQILGLLQEISHERKVPAILVTHDQQAERYVDRILTLKDGHLHDGVAHGLLSST